MRNNLLFFASCLVLLFFIPAGAQSESTVKEGEAWVQQVEESLGKTFGDLNRRQIGPGGGVPSGSDGKDGTEGNDTNFVGGGPGTRGPGSGDSDGVERDPSKLDPSSSDIAALIREWLSIAEPPKNAQGANFRYTAWGSLEGRGIGGKTVRVDRPDAAAGMIPEAYVWSIRNTLDSIDHCMVEEYVIATLAHKSITHCKGRYQKSQGVQVENVVGIPHKTARKILEEQGLEVNLSLGKPAVNEAQVFTVIRQDPAPSKSVAPGTVITLMVFNEMKSLIKIPSVVGFPNTTARNQLLAAGFTVKPNPMGKAPESNLAFTVKSSTPPANTEVKPGSLVVLNTYDAFDDGKTTGLEKPADCPMIARNSAGVGETVSCHCSTTATSQGSVFGNGLYTDDSSTCRAALHAGEVTTEGGNISFTMRKSQPHYDSTSHNGVTSYKWGTYSGNSFAFQSLSDAKERCPNTAYQYRGTGNVVSCECTAEAADKGAVYGNGVYTDDSKICRAAVHAGEITPGGGHVAFAMRKGQPSYEGNKKNGVTSKSWGAFKGSFTFAGALNPNTVENIVENVPGPKHDADDGRLACLCKGGDGYNRNDQTCDSPNSPASIFGGKSDTAYPSGVYPFTNECSHPIKSGEKPEGLDPEEDDSNNFPANAYVIDRVEIPKPSYRTTGSIICDIQISKNSRVKDCKHHKNEGLVKLQIQHGFRLRAENGSTFVPGEKVYLEISGSISGHSIGYSFGDYVAARFEPKRSRFTTESSSGDGDGWAMNNSDLPFIKRASVISSERRGSASMHLTRVATFPDTKGKPVKIVLNGTNGGSLVIYHLKPAKK